MSSVEVEINSLKVQIISIETKWKLSYETMFTVSPPPITSQGNCFGLIKDNIPGLDKSGPSDPEKPPFMDSLVPKEMKINWPSKSSAKSESSYELFLE
jgi:hypothetical protein